MSNPSGDGSNGGQPPQWGQQPQQPGQPGQPGQPNQWQQPPAGQQPPAQQPGQWGPPPGQFQQFGQNPYETPPKKSRGPLIAALVALVLVIVGGVVAAIVMLGGDEDDDTSATDDSSSQSTEPSPTADSDPTEAEPTEADPTTAPPADGSQVVGKGYVYTLPEGWSDVTEEFKASGSSMPSIDTVSAAGKALAMSPGNFIVETMPITAGTTPEDLRSGWERTVTGALGDVTPLPTDNVDFGGSEAIGMRFEHDKNPANLPLVQHAYLFVDDDVAFAVSLTMQASEEDELFAEFTELRESWTFQG
ncbi:hypothetical protein NODU109028_20730 [Nocardioides dubius]|uniref:Uncharacterized protein n=1 Tax=Nocardioides dubius TaxID=317019 RepID=A0ABP4EK83_9ACTN